MSAIITQVYRVKRRDSAFLYAILESLEGMVSFSTLEGPARAALVEADYRAIEMYIPQSFQKDVEVVLSNLRKTIALVRIER